MKKCIIITAAVLVAVGAFAATIAVNIFNEHPEICDYYKFRLTTALAMLCFTFVGFIVWLTVQWLRGKL